MPRIQVSLLAALICVAAPAAAQFTQSGNKLVGAPSVGVPAQGSSVAVSADGSTVAVGGPQDASGAGAAWLYTRSNGLQTIKLVGTGVSKGIAAQGSAVALSADGNTLIVGGINDNLGTGAIWPYFRSNGVWSPAPIQQVSTTQSKLWGTVISGISHQGVSAALSADGNTALVGGDLFNNETGAAWVFYRINGVWSVFADRLEALGTVPNTHLGVSVALSADGNTAILGAPGDNSGTGAAFVFTRAGAGAQWLQQAKLIGSGAVGNAAQVTSVAISGDGNTVLIGGPADNNTIGAVWVFTRANAQWTQQTRLTGSDALVSRYLGQSAALSGDGNIAVVGGPGGVVTNTFGRRPAIGATWIFVRSNGIWSQQSSELVGAGTTTNDALEGTAVAISADGRTAIVGGPVDNGNVGAAWIFAQPAIVAPPAIVTQPASATIAGGQTATLSVTANGSAPLTYQWYQGTPGNTSTPVGTNSSSFTTPALIVTTAYWVRVTNQYGAADSASAVVTVPVNAPVITQVTNAANNSTAIAPNTWVSIFGTNLAPAGDTRTWQSSDFVNDQMPSQLDGVSVTVNGQTAYVAYISPTQVNVLTSPNPMQGPVQVVLNNSKAAGAPFTAQAQTISPSFFVVGGGQYVAAEHANGSYLGPASLYPGVTTPAKPGETIALFGNGFGPTTPPVVLGSSMQMAPLSTLPVVVIGGNPASVQFAGLVTPGLYQINVVVPVNTPDGDNSITAVYNGIATQTGVLVTVAR